MKLFGRIPKENTKEPKVLVCSLNHTYQESLEVDGKVYLRHYGRVDSVIFSGLGDFLTALQQGYDIVHLFCPLSTGGILRDQTETGLTGTDLITKCCENKVKLLWIASEIGADDYIKGFHAGSKPINLIMTIRRNGTKFHDFLNQFISMVSRGETLPVAWAKLVPQAKGPWNEDLPSCIFAAGMPRADLSSNNQSSKPS